MQNNELAVKLGKKLKEIYDNDAFIIEVMSNVTHPEDQQKVLDFIEAGDDVDDETVSVLAMDLADERELKDKM